MTSDAAIRARFTGHLGHFQLDAGFVVPARGVTALFGPSGCGKTTLLRCIAGLTHVREGFVSVGGEIWQDDKRFIPVHERAIGYVFQDASLFPHLSVQKNLLYGARKATVTGALVRFDEVVDFLGLGKLLARSPRNLSGGERQRVAIGRALLSQPRLLLMDEPLSALDRSTKDEILPYLERLHDTLSLPVIYISHDMAEVERLADELVLMEDGHVVASGPINRLQSDIDLPLLAARDAAVSLDAIVLDYDARDALATLSVAGGSFLAPSGHVSKGDRQRLQILAGDISLSREKPNQSTIVNVLPARILRVRETREHQVTAVIGLGADGDGAQLLSRVTRRSWTLLGLAPGIVVYAQVKGVALVRQRGS